LSRRVNQIQFQNNKLLQPRQPPTTKNKEKQVVIEEVEELTKRRAEPTQLDQNVLAHLKKLPTLLSIYHTLVLSKKLRKVLIKALQNP